MQILIITAAYIDRYEESHREGANIVLDSFDQI